jgi:hypothetical protein
MIGERKRIFQKMILEWQLDVTSTSQHDTFPQSDKEGWRFPTKEEISSFYYSNGDQIEHPERYWCELAPGNKIGTYNPKTLRFYPLEESVGEFGLRLVRTPVSRIRVTREVGLVQGAEIKFS